MLKISPQNDGTTHHYTSDDCVRLTQRGEMLIIKEGNAFVALTQQNLTELLPLLQRFSQEGTLPGPGEGQGRGVFAVGNIVDIVDGRYKGEIAKVTGFHGPTMPYVQGVSNQNLSGYIHQDHLKLRDTTGEVYP